MPELLPFEVAIWAVNRNANFQFWGESGVNVKIDYRDPKSHFLARKRVGKIGQPRRPVGEVKKRKKGKGKSQTVIFHACAETPHAAGSLPYLEVEVGSPT